MTDQEPGMYRADVRPDDIDYITDIDWQCYGCIPCTHTIEYIDHRGSRLRTKMDGDYIWEIIKNQSYQANMSETTLEHIKMYEKVNVVRDC